MSRINLPWNRFRRQQYRRVLKMPRRLKLLYLVTEDWYFISHRLSLAIAAKAAGFDVSVATRVQCHGDTIRDAGIGLLPISLSRSGLHPIREFRSMAELVTLIRGESPDLLHNVAMKPITYGTLAARLSGTKAVINAIMGLGWTFSSESAKARMLRPLIKIALRNALSGVKTRVIVQNKDDASVLSNQRLVRPEAIRLIRGSGVDPKAYSTRAPPPGPPLVVLPARLIVSKGILEFMQAAALLKSDGIDARFALVGAPDTASPAAVTCEMIQPYVRAGQVEYWGWRDDMAQVLNIASVVCLPTFYGEGLPKSLLEAAASARAIVATDVPGCREVVHHGENGWLVPPCNTEALARALRESIARPELCARYGAAGRLMVEREFSLDAVIKQTLALYNELI